MSNVVREEACFGRVLKQEIVFGPSTKEVAERERERLAREKGNPFINFRVVPA